MLPWMGAADPGRVHTEGRMARAAIEDAREKVAALLGARPREVVFTSGATEAANAAVYGALLVRRGLRLPPMILGGEQERARRAGLENVPAIIGFGAAAEAVLAAPDEAGRNRDQSARILSAASAVDGVIAYGPADPAARLPHIVCVGVEGVEAEPILLGLDQSGVAAHSGSSCSSESLEPSPVLEAMGVDADHSLRISVGWSTTDADIAAFEEAFPAVVARLRALR